MSYQREFLGTDAAIPLFPTSHVSHDNEDVTVYLFFTNCVFETCTSFNSAGGGIVAGLWIDGAMRTSGMVCTQIHNDVLE